MRNAMRINSKYSLDLRLRLYLVGTNGLAEFADVMNQRIRIINVNSMRRVRQYDLLAVARQQGQLRL